MLVALAALCAVLWATEVILLSAAQWNPGSIVLWMSIVGLFFLSGLVALRRQPHKPFGTLLLLAGLAQWCAGLMTVPVLGLSVIGLLARSLPVALMIHVIVAFPTGRLTGRLARFTVALAYATSVLLEVPKALLDPTGPFLVAGETPAGLLVAAGAGQRVFGLACLVLAMVTLWIRLIGRRDSRLGPFILYGFACLVGMALAIVVRLLAGLSIQSPNSWSGPRSCRRCCSPPCPWSSCSVC